MKRTGIFFCTESGLISDQRPRHRCLDVRGQRHKPHLILVGVCQLSHPRLGVQDLGDLVKVFFQRSAVRKGKLRCLNIGNINRTACRVGKKVFSFAWTSHRFRRDQQAVGDFADRKIFSFPAGFGGADTGLVYRFVDVGYRMSAS